MKYTVKNIHFVGIGGIGMSGIAEVLLTQGYSVSGSDIGISIATERLSMLGAKVACGHDAANVKGADVVVISSAVGDDNPEVRAARHARIPIVPRAVMLAELMRLKQGIAIAGTHGKTTTTSLVASVLAEGKLDPTFVIGGRLTSAGANARLGTGDFIVAEADESDASFLNLFPVIEVVTNIDADHMDTYGQDFTRLEQAFVDFTKRLPFYGIAVMCVDDPNVRQILPFISKPIVRYGFAKDAQVRAIDVVADGQKMRFMVLRESGPPLQITLNLPGRHNVQNALAAIAIAMELEISDEAIQRALREFNGVGRRFQRFGDFPCKGGGYFTLIDDYGHHPVEMAATIDAARAAFPGRRLVLAFQPHRYTRTRDCFSGFVDVLSRVDALALTDIYSAGEAPIIKVDGRALASAVTNLGKVKPVFVETVNALPDAINRIVQDGDVVITMGAGSVETVPYKLLKERYNNGSD